MWSKKTYGSVRYREVSSIIYQENDKISRETKFEQLYVIAEIVSGKMITVHT